jgi:hypothetical protein
MELSGAGSKMIHEKSLKKTFLLVFEIFFAASALLFNFSSSNPLVRITNYVNVGCI